MMETTECGSRTNTLAHVCRFSFPGPQATLLSSKTKKKNAHELTWTCHPFEQKREWKDHEIILLDKQPASLPVCQPPAQQCHGQIMIIIGFEAKVQSSTHLFLSISFSQSRSFQKSVSSFPFYNLLFSSALVNYHHNHVCVCVCVRIVGCGTFPIAISPTIDHEHKARQSCLSSCPRKVRSERCTLYLQTLLFLMQTITVVEISHLSDFHVSIVQCDGSKTDKNKIKLQTQMQSHILSKFLGIRRRRRHLNS